MWVRKIRFIVAPPIILAGLFFVFLPFAFATMLDGDPDKPLGWREYLGEVFTHGIDSLSIGVPAIILGFTIAAGGGPITPGEGDGGKRG
jgi:hypothetical protein